MEYKGYIGKVEFDDEAGIFHGEIINTRDVITFQGTTVQEIRQAFTESIEDYLDFCAQLGQAPEKPFTGKLMLRLPPDLHRQAYIAAKNTGKSLNSWITDCIGQMSHAH